MKKRIPGDFEEDIRFFGRFTWKDLVRLAAPTAIMMIWVDFADSSLFETVVLLGVTGFIGGTWYLYRPYGRPVENLVFHLLRWVIRKVVL